MRALALSNQLLTEKKAFTPGDRKELEYYTIELHFIEFMHDRIRIT